MLILSGHGLSLQNAVNIFYSHIDHTDELVTASAYWQARRKLKPSLYQELTHLIVEQFYQTLSEEQPPRTLQGRRLVAIDLSVLRLPDTQQWPEEFASSPNQHSTVVEASASVLYDVLNQIAISAHLGRRSSAAEALLEHHLEHLDAGDILLADREFGDYSIIAALSAAEREFVIRLQRNSFKAAQEFLASDQNEAIVEITVTDKQRQYVGQHHLPEHVRLRLVKIPLDTGEIELLATSLLDAEQYNSEVLKQVYGSRWGIETYFDRLKNIYEVERFSGFSQLIIEQDFYGMVFLTSLEGVLAAPVEEDFQRRNHERSSGYAQHVNHAVSYAALLHQVTQLLLDDTHTTEQLLEQLQHLLRRAPTLQRPQRNHPRTPRGTSSRLNFHKYRRRRPP